MDGPGIWMVYLKETRPPPANCRPLRMWHPLERDTDLGSTDRPVNWSNLAGKSSFLIQKQATVNWDLKMFSWEHRNIGKNHL